MSVKAMAWAWEQECQPTAKLVLLAICDHSDHEGKSFPSFNAIANKTGLTRRSVIDLIHKLEALGLIEIELRTRQDGALTSSLYRVKMHTPSEARSLPLVKHVHHPSEAASPPVVNQMHPPSEAASPPLKGSEPPSEPSIEPSIIRGRHAETDLSLLEAHGITGQLAADFITHRKAKITQIAIEGIQREATAAGLSLVDAVRMMIERGWQGFKAEWLTVTKSGNVINAKSKFINSGFESIHYEDGLI